MAGVTSSGADAAASSAGSVLDAPKQQMFADLLIWVSAAWAQQLLDVTPDRSTWHHLGALEAEVADALKRLRPLSDPRSSRIEDLRLRLTVIRKVLEYMGSHELRPSPLQPDGVAAEVTGLTLEPA